MKKFSAIALLVLIAVVAALSQRRATESSAEVSTSPVATTAAPVVEEAKPATAVVPTGVPGPRNESLGQNSLPVSPPPKYSSPPVRPNSAPNAVPVAHSGNSVFVPGFPPRNAAVPPAPWLPAEQRLNRLANDRDVEEFNRRVRAKDLSPYVNSAAPYAVVFPQAPPAASSPSTSFPATEATPKPPSLDRLLGNYEGEIRFDGGKRVWQMTLELSGKVEGKKLKGQSLVDLSEDGKTISKTTQSGELSLLKKLADNSAGILLVPADGQYFQLYYLNDRDQLTGNYYVREGSTQMVPKGTVRLSRKAPPRG